MDELIVGLSEANAPRTLVLKGPGGYRMDPDPKHTREEWEDVWTQDIKRAHVFDEVSIRKFMKGFMYNDIRRSVRTEPVDVVDGYPQSIKAGGFLS